MALQKILDLIFAPIPKRLCMTVASLDLGLGRVSQITTDRVDSPPWNNWKR